MSRISEAGCTGNMGDNLAVGRVHGAETDVVGAFLLGLQGLIQVVGRFADNLAGPSSSRRASLHCRHPAPGERHRHPVPWPAATSSLTIKATPKLRQSCFSSLPSARQESCPSPLPRYWRTGTPPRSAVRTRSTRIFVLVGDEIYPSATWQAAVPHLVDNETDWSDFLLLMFVLLETNKKAALTRTSGGWIYRYISRAAFLRRCKPDQVQRV